MEITSPKNAEEIKDKYKSKTNMFLFCFTEVKGDQKESRLLKGLTRKENSKHLLNIHGLFSYEKCA